MSGRIRAPSLGFAASLASPLVAAVVVMAPGCSRFHSCTQLATCVGAGGEGGGSGAVGEAGASATGGTSGATGGTSGSSGTSVGTSGRGGATASAGRGGAAATEAGASGEAGFAGDEGIGKAGSSGAGDSADAGGAGEAGMASGGEAGTGSADASTRFVDPISGVDIGQCPLAAPCKTLSYTLTIAAPFDTVYLNPGNYSASSGETFTTPIPTGVVIESRVIGQAIFMSDGTGLAFSITDDATLRYLQLRGFEQGIAVSAGTLTLEAIEFQEVSYPIVANGTAELSMTGGQIRDSFGGIETNGDAVAEVTDLEIVNSGRGTSCGLSGNVLLARGNSALTLDGIVGTSLSGNLRFYENATVVVRNSTFAGLADCAPRWAADSARTATIQRVAFKDQSVSFSNTMATECEFERARVSTSGITEIHSSSFVGSLSSTPQGTGIIVSSTLTLSDSSFLGLQIGLQVGPYTTSEDVTVRGSTFANNDVGVRARERSSRPISAVGCVA